MGDLFFSLVFHNVHYMSGYVKYNNVRQFQNNKFKTIIEYNFEP